MLTMTGHVGFFNLVNTTDNAILIIFSVDENYKYENLFSKGTISKIANEINWICKTKFIFNLLSLFKYENQNTFIFCKINFKNFRKNN